MGSEIFGKVSKFVTEDKSPGVEGNFAGGDWVNEDRAIIDRAPDPCERSGIFAILQSPLNIFPGRAGDFSSDGLEFGEIFRRSISRVWALGFPANGTRSPVGWDRTAFGLVKSLLGRWLSGGGGGFQR